MEYDSTVASVRRLFCWHPLLIGGARWLGMGRPERVHRRRSGAEKVGARDVPKKSVFGRLVLQSALCPECAKGRSGRQHSGRSLIYLDGIVRAAPCASVTETTPTIAALGNRQRRRRHTASRQKQVASSALRERIGLSRRETGKPSPNHTHQPKRQSETEQVTVRRQ